MPQTTDISFLTVLEARSPRSRCQQVGFILKPLFLACRGRSPPPRYSPDSFFKNIYFLLGCAGSSCCARAFSSCGVFTRCTGLAAPRHAESSQTKDPTPCLLHWQADSHPLYHQGSPSPDFLFVCVSGRGLERELCCCCF